MRPQRYYCLKCQADRDLLTLKDSLFVKCNKHDVELKERGVEMLVIETGVSMKCEGVTNDP